MAPVSKRAIRALHAHWRDRGMEVYTPPSAAALITAVDVPEFLSAARNKHDANLNRGAGHSADALYQFLAAAIRRLQRDPAEAGFALYQFHVLERLSPYVLRHTFGTLAAADVLPLDVAHSNLWHQSSSTTAIYVQAKAKRMEEEAIKYIDGKKRFGRIA